MVTAGAGIELATTTPQAAIADATGAADVITRANAIIAALEVAGILTPN